MPTAEAMRQAVRDYASRFTAGDREAWLGLFVEEPEITEPADAPARYGRAVLAAVFDATKGAGIDITLTPLSIIVNGYDAAWHMQVLATLPDGKVIESSVIEIFSFAEDGRIARLRAFLDAGQ